MRIDPTHGIVGAAGPRVDGLAQATGTLRFLDDLAYPDMLWGKILRSHHAHARTVPIATSRAPAATPAPPPTASATRPSRAWTRARPD